MTGEGAKHTPESKARASALGSLAMREHSSLELQNKLLQKNHPEAVVFALIEELQHAGLLSDERFAECYWRMRSGKGYGPVRITQELKQKGVSDRLIQSALLEADVDFDTLISSVYEKKYRGQPWTDYKEKAKRQNFLYRRGFGHDLIRQVIE